MSVFFYCFNVSSGDVQSSPALNCHQTDSLTPLLHSCGRHVNYTDSSQFDLDTNERKEFKLCVKQAGLNRGSAEPVAPRKPMFGTMVAREIGKASIAVDYRSRER